MNPRYDLLPKHKGDDKIMQQLHDLSEAELQPLLPKLLECLLDSNWPIAKAAWELLLPRVQVLESAILEVLADTDTTWKSNVMGLINHSPLSALSPALRQAVEQIAYSPSAAEQTEGTDEDARTLLAKYN